MLATIGDGARRRILRFENHGYRPALSRKALAAVFGAHGFRAGDYWATGLAGGFLRFDNHGLSP